MSCPFPGMDPYLEGSMSLHAQLVAEIARQLSPQLLPKYVAHTTERFVADGCDDVAISASIYPDVSVAPILPGDKAPATVSCSSAPLQAATVMPAAVPHTSVEIRDTRNRQLVTAIEVLSPSNKRGAGRIEYLEKRNRILLSSAHLLEIDLVSQGERVPMQEPLPAARYFVILSRANRRPIVDVWPIRLEDELPTVPIPLMGEDPDARLDLGAAFAAIYDLLGYRYQADYTQPPPAPLDEQEAAWVQERLSATGWSE